MFRSKIFLLSCIAPSVALASAIGGLSPLTQGVVGLDLANLHPIQEQTERGTVVNRNFKGDRAAFASTARAHEKQLIASVEVVGVREAAVVYRDREGNILFRIDPETNTTVAVKDVLLPQVTLRETLQPMPAPVRAPKNIRPEPRIASAESCDSTFTLSNVRLSSRRVGVCYTHIVNRARLAEIR